MVAILIIFESLMSDTNSTLSAFMAETKTEQRFWALQDKTSEDWVVLDSVNFEKTEVNFIAAKVNHHSV